MADLIPTTDIVPLADLKAALNVTLDLDDAKLTAKLEAARDVMEAYVGPLDDFASAEAVPAAVKEAMKLYAGNLYDADAAPVPEGFYALIGPYRAWEF